eukprot:m51a1_g10823 hypothetical protein (140) ;mRNA; r:5736-6219
MASKLSLVLVLAAAALASASLTVIVSPARQSLNTFTAQNGPIFVVMVNNRVEHIFGQEINCHAYYAYLDYFGQPWTHPIDEEIMACNSGRTGDCDTWYAAIPAPANNNTVVEAVAYCQHNNGPKIWAQGTGNIRFQRAN